MRPFCQAQALHQPFPLTSVARDVRHQFLQIEHGAGTSSRRVATETCARFARLKPCINPFHLPLSRVTFVISFFRSSMGPELLRDGWRRKHAPVLPGSSLASTLSTYLCRA